ncbi:MULTISPECIES: hypothetical protein [Streptomyces]|uniref:hypothetical protein n=1 Tax=Streptomyces TaxID=1883 RepID=UPI000F78F690|nr:MULTISPECIES: hypothetical protein [Streptomyces]RST07362.1 hypothetical protein EF910_06690 [Streptomyces sp. WAC07149]GLX18864.1 hypothetical protein Slala01_25080 [Streptomyces lavendulae subsp. lavendulae]GLX29214.1 hypothetical protein Slala02_50340 [Streptomyces lavendulae subsp. lavendulae]
MPVSPTRPLAPGRTAAPVRAAAAQGILLCFLFCTATLPVLAIPLTLGGLIVLHTAADAVIIPFWSAALLLMWRSTPVARAARSGFLSGLVAVTAYDMLRLPVIHLGGWPDFIPRLGGWITASDRPNAAVGYAWRYIGDGGGIGMAFALFCLVAGIRRRLVPWGLAYGVFVWSGLIATVLLVLHGQLLLFRLTPSTLTASLAGHLIYGSTLGYCLSHLDTHHAVLADPPLHLHRPAPRH